MSYLGVHAVDGVAHILAGGDDEAEGHEDHDGDAVVQAEHGRVNVDVAHFDEVLKASKDVQHVGAPKPQASGPSEAGLGAEARRGSGAAGLGDPLVRAAARYRSRP